MSVTPYTVSLEKHHILFGKREISMELEFPITNLSLVINDVNVASVIHVRDCTKLIFII